LFKFLRISQKEEEKTELFLVGGNVIVTRRIKEEGEE
jgi:hypothetical protein